MNLFATQRRAMPRPRLLSDKTRDLLGAAACGVLLFALALLTVEYPHGIWR